MKPFAWLGALAFVAVALAGCSSGGDGGLEGLDDCPGGECAEGAAIKGRVLDDAQLPLAGASVGIVETGNQTTTDDAGAFAFYGLDAGTYTVSAVSLGFSSEAQRITLEADEVREVVFNLAAIPITEPYSDVIGPESGHFNCMVGTPSIIRNCNAGGAMGDDKTSVTFELSAPDAWQTLVGEMRWEQGSAATSSHLANYVSYVGRSGNHWWCAADGEAPIVFQYEREGDSVCSDQGSEDPQPEDEEVEELLIAADSGFGGTSTDNPPLRLALGQRYELMISVFYHEPAPAGYSALPDQ